MRILRLMGCAVGLAAASAMAQSVSIEEMAPAKLPGKPVAGVAGPAAGAGLSSMPLKKIALYKTGVALFERSGMVTGNALIHIDFTTSQLNDVLQSLTVTDLGGGAVAGLGFDNTETLGEQLAELHLNLGPDPTVAEFLEAMKGKRVEIRGAGAVVTGKLLNVETKLVTNAHGGERSEKRFVSVVGDGGTLRTVELGPTVEVRLADAGDRVEIGRYLKLLGTTHDPPMRHLTLETQGKGRREIRISYIGAMPAWKSNYRVLPAKDGVAATLEGWAVVDNTTTTDWENVELTLVTGAPRSFVQAASRPQNVVRPEVPMAGGALTVKRPSPIGVGDGSAPMSASPVSGADGVQVSRVAAAVGARVGDAGTGDSAKADATAVDADELFEYKLAKPMSIKRNESEAVPILTTPIEAERVSVWLAREQTKGVQRGLWLRNTSGLTLDQGAFSIMENGMFAGQGQLPLMHPGERWIVAYGSDTAIQVTPQGAKDLPTIVRHVDMADGRLSVHQLLRKERDFAVRNVASSPRTAVLGVPQSDPIPRMGPWELSPETPAAEVVGEPRGKHYRFEVKVEANATATLKVIEEHAHPTHYTLAEMKPEEIDGVIRDSHDNADVRAKLKPIADAKRKIAELDAQMKEQQKAIDDVNKEEARLRQNIATLKGTTEEQALTKRYAAAMLAQEDKLAGLQTQREAAEQQKSATQKAMAAQIKGLQAAIKIPAV